MLIQTIQPGDDINSYLDLVSQSGGGILKLNPLSTFYPTGDINIPNNTTIDFNNGVIDFQNQPYSIKAIGADEYSDGTISINNTDSIVIGTGTDWTSDMVGQTIQFSGNFFTILNVSDPTTITIDGIYIGSNLVNVNYSLATALTFCNILNVTIQNSSESGLVFKNTNYCTINNINIFNCLIGLEMDWIVAIGITGSGGLIDSCGTGFKFSNSYGFTIDNSTASNSTIGPGIELINSGDAEIRDAAVTGNVTDGIKMTNVSQLSINSLTVAFNGNAGLNLVSNNTNNQLFAISTVNNGTYGIDIADATSEDNIISINTFSGDSSGSVNDSGTGTLIRSNIGVADN